MVSREDIIGTWLMVDRGTDDPSDEAASLSRYGPDPQGLLIISAEGWINAAISWSNRPGLTGLRRKLRYRQAPPPPSQ